MGSPFSLAGAIAWPSRWASREAHLELADDALPKPEMNRQERVIFTAYLAMATLIVAFLAITLVVWLGS